MSFDHKRKYFGEIHDAIPLPNLIEAQIQSYEWFLKDGLRELLDEVSPLQVKNLTLSFKGYNLEKPKFDEITAKERNVTYEAPLRATAILVNEDTKEEKEQEVYLGEIPLMTKAGTFIINGIERVVVSQLVRSSGIFFVSENSMGKTLFGAKIIPSRGAWLEIETNSNDVISVKIDRGRRIPATTLLRALGWVSDNDIANLFSSVNTDPERNYILKTIERDPSRDESSALIEVYKRVRPGDLATAENSKLLLETKFFNFRYYDLGRAGRYKINQKFNQNHPIDTAHRILLKEDVIKTIEEVISLNNGIGEADDIDHLGNRRINMVGELLQNKFRVGLLRVERIAKDRMSITDPQGVVPAQLINARPIIAAMQEFFASSQLSQFMDQTNPLSELGHKRRLSAMGPGGLSRERAGFEVRDVHRSHYGRICPVETPEGPNIGLVGSMATYSKLNEYGFLETPYRRVHNKVKNKASQTKGHYIWGELKDPKTGKVVAKEEEFITEALAKRLEKLDLDEIPVRAFTAKEIEYLDAIEEEKKVIAPATTPIDENGILANMRVPVRRFGKPDINAAGRIDYLDVSPKQIVGVSASLIPFLEHDDASRAQLGSNMQRQAVPLIRPQAPLVGTGVEYRVGVDSGYAVVAKNDGVVSKSNATEVFVKSKGKEERYPLLNFIRSNQGTCIHQFPVVERGDKVKAGDVLADSYCTEEGEIALGQNVLVAFMPFGGGNFEDAVLISERLVKNDNYTSVHVERFQIDVRDTKLGPEVVTRDIPNVGEDALSDLDAEGIVRIGAEVKAGDILVGKITPKGEAELSAEEKLLRAIFGEKAKDVKDTSLRLSHGKRGKVVDVTIFSKDKGDKLPVGVSQAIQVSVAQVRKITVGDKMAGRHGNKGVISRILPVEDMPFLPDGTPVDIILNPLGVSSRMNIGQIFETHLGWAASKLGYKVASPVFDGVNYDTIKQELEKADLPANGKVQIFDGRTGMPFESEVTVGVIYMLKLSHMVEDKIHARSIGPYSLVTQQPLGGKAQFGGQRFGEMEVWALEAYGASHILQEMLTIKSDDVSGRSKTYLSIIKGEEIQAPTIPESFKVLIKELQSLGLVVELLGEKVKIGAENKKDIQIEQE